MTTETDNGGETGRLLTSGSVKIEWNWDLDDESLQINSIRRGDQKFVVGKEGRFELRGRCRRCWGGLIGKRDAGHDPMAIRCRVCDLRLEGDKARVEYERMSHEGKSNASSMLLAMPAKYRDDATFVLKLFPYMDRLSDEEFRQRVGDEVQKADKKGWLTRRSFSAGSAGFLFLQAEALMSGVERLPRELSVMPLWDIETHDDRSATLHPPTEQLGEHSKTSEKETMKTLGSTMTVALMSSLACELAMKAICLTRRDEARKIHDLWELYSDLPVDSRTRIEEDFPEVGSVVKDARHIFGKWRYFEVDVGAPGINAMIDTDRALSLGKAARVLLDEALLMGLGYSLRIKGDQRITKASYNARVHSRVKLKLDATAREAPPR